MKVTYYSEDLKKYFDTEEACIKAEQELAAKMQAEEEKKAKRKEASKEVEAKLAAAQAATKEANEALAAFCKEYGAWHTSITDVPSTKSFMDILFDSFLL